MRTETRIDEGRQSKHCSKRSQHYFLASKMRGESRSTSKSKHHSLFQKNLSSGSCKLSVRLPCACCLPHTGRMGRVISVSGEKKNPPCTHVPRQPSRTRASSLSVCLVLSFPVHRKNVPGDVSVWSRETLPCMHVLCQPSRTCRLSVCFTLLSFTHRKNAPCNISVWRREESLCTYVPRQTARTSSMPAAAHR